MSLAGVGRVGRVGMVERVRMVQHSVSVCRLEWRPVIGWSGRVQSAPAAP